MHEWKKGVMFIQDLCHSNRWLTLTEFKDKFSIDFIRRYRGFIAALKTYRPEIRHSLNYNDLSRFNEHSAFSGQHLDVKLILQKHESITKSYLKITSKPENTNSIFNAQAGT